MPDIYLLAESDPWCLTCPTCGGQLWESKTNHDQEHYYECDKCGISCVWCEV